MSSIGDFLKDILGGIVDKDGSEVGTSDILKILAGIGGASYAKDKGYFDPDVPVVGYQGEIPKYQAIQEVVKGRDDSNRRPGSGGRRYMSDVIYAKAPDNQGPMSVAKAQAKAKAQAQGFAEGGDVAAFFTGVRRWRRWWGLPKPISEYAASRQSRTSTYANRSCTTGTHAYACP